MRRYILLVILIPVLHLNVLSQSLNNYWLFGYDGTPSWGLPYGGTDFIFANDSLSAINYHYREMSFREESVSISDSVGDLLFYSNGIFIANSLDDTMMNGSGLNPSYFTTTYANKGMHLTQGGLIIPIPGDSSKYYLFHETAELILIPSGFSTYLPNQLLYSIIDMSLDSGKGAVISKNQVLLNDTLIDGQLTCVKHANGRDYWLIAHKFWSDIYYSFLITPYGIQGPFTQSIGPLFQGGVGQVSFSPDGEWYAKYSVIDSINLLRFDRCAGTFSSVITIPAPHSGAGGIAFSANSRYLYVSSNPEIYQYDLLDSNIASSQISVATWDGFYSPNPPFACNFYLEGLAPDGKIYVNSNNGVLHMHKINYPDSAGLACDVQQHSIALPTFNAFTMPNYPNYFLGPVTGSVCDSLSTGVKDDIYNTNLKLRINPNPASNMFYLNYTLPTGTNADLHIYNTLGSEVMRKKLYWYFGYLQIDATTLQNGVYFLKIETPKGSARGKVVIAR